MIIVESVLLETIVSLRRRPQVLLINQATGIELFLSRQLRNTLIHLLQTLVQLQGLLEALIHLHLL